MRPRDHAMIALFVGPIATCADESASYALVAKPLLLHVITAVAAFATVTAVAVSYRVLRRRTETFPVDRFVALMGLFLNAFFLLVVLAGFGIPKLLLHPTD